MQLQLFTYFALAKHAPFRRATMRWYRSADILLVNYMCTLFVVITKLVDPSGRGWEVVRRTQTHLAANLLCKGAPHMQRYLHFSFLWPISGWLWMAMC
jgi:hypothetical protein